LDTALTGTITVLDESHVATFSPAGAPRVLHDPVVQTSGGVVTVSDNEGGVVEISSASFVKDSTLVSLEIEFGGINTDGDGADSDGFLHRCDIVRLSISLRSNDHVGGLVLVVGACSLLSLVGVVRLGHTLGASFSVVFESPCLETSIASHVLFLVVITVNELLLGEGSEFVSLDFPATFEGSSRGE